MIREKRIKSGKLLEVNIYPVTRDGKHIFRGPKSKVSSEQQTKYNQKQAQKRAVRLLNANFDESDVIIHLTYSENKRPDEYEQAKRDIVNYLRRIKTFRERKAEELRSKLKAEPRNKELRAQLRKAEEPLKYIYTIEAKKRGGYHFHLILSGCGYERDWRDYRSIWNKGISRKADRYDPDYWGPEKIGAYLVKQADHSYAPPGAKKFVCSRNLRKPEEKIKDGKLTSRRVELMGTVHQEDREYWERRYRGYRVVKIVTGQNRFNQQWYVSLVMYRNSEESEWDMNDWFDDDEYIDSFIGRRKTNEEELQEDTS